MALISCIISLFLYVSLFSKIEFEDIFSHLFGGFGGCGGVGGLGGLGGLFGGHHGGGRGGHSQRRRRTQDMVYPLKVTLEDLYNGKTASIELDRSILCKTCQGYFYIMILFFCQYFHLSVSLDKAVNQVQRNLVLFAKATGL